MSLQQLFDTNKLQGEWRIHNVYGEFLFSIYAQTGNVTEVQDDTVFADLDYWLSCDIDCINSYGDIYLTDE